MTYKPATTKVEGGQSETIVSDDNVQSLLQKILMQLQIMNMHLQILTDNEIREDEIDE